MAGRRSQAPIPDDCPAEFACNVCGQTKPRADFPRNAYMRRGYAYMCRECGRDATTMSRLRKELRDRGPEEFQRRTQRDILLLQMRFAVIAEQTE